MELVLSKKTISSLLIFLWIVFSVIYIGWDLWSDFKNVQIVRAYQQGKADTINALIAEVEKCGEVPVTGTEKQISVIGTHCLTQREGK